MRVAGTSRGVVVSSGTCRTSTVSSGVFCEGSGVESDEICCCLKVSGALIITFEDTVMREAK